MEKRRVMEPIQEMAGPSQVEVDRLYEYIRFLRSRLSCIASGEFDSAERCADWANTTLNNEMPELPAENAQKSDINLREGEKETER